MEFLENIQFDFVHFILLVFICLCLCLMIYFILKNIRLSNHVKYLIYKEKLNISLSNLDNISEVINCLKVFTKSYRKLPKKLADPLYQLDIQELENNLVNYYSKILLKEDFFVSRVIYKSLQEESFCLSKMRCIFLKNILEKVLLSYGAPKLKIILNRIDLEEVTYKETNDEECYLELLSLVKVFVGNIYLKLST